MSDSRSNLGDDALLSLYASPINQTITEMLGSGTKINPQTQVTVQDINDLAKRCEIPTIPDASLTKEDIASKIHFWLQDNNERPTTIRMIMNSAPSMSGGSHYFVAEFNVNNAGKVDAVNIIDSLDKDSTHNQAYRDSLQSEILAALQFTDESITSALGVDGPTYKLTSPFIQPDAWSCGYYVLMNLINSLDKDKPKPGHDDTSLRAKLRTAHDTASQAINTELAGDAKLQLANALRDMCFEELGVDPKTGLAIAAPPTSSSAAAATQSLPNDGVSTAPAAPSPTSDATAQAAPAAAVAKPAFQNMMVKFTDKNHRKQAQEIVDFISSQPNNHTKFGLTYSANSQQTAAIHRYNNDPSDTNYEAMKLTFERAANQGAVVRELFSIIDETKDEKIKSLKGKIRILPITTILRNHTGDHPTTDKQLDDDIGHIIDFATNNGCILGWQNEKSGTGTYAIGGVIAGNNFNEKQQAHVQAELKKLHTAIANGEDIPPQVLLARTTVPVATPLTAPASPPAAKPEAQPTSPRPSSNASAPAADRDGDAHPNVSADTEVSIADHINAVFKGIETGETATEEFEESLKAIGIPDDKIRLLAKRANDANRNADDIKSDQEKQFFEFSDIYPKQKLEALNRSLLASVNQYVELKLSEHSDDAKLKELEDSINGLKKQLEDARDTLEALQSHTDKISPNKIKACEADLSERLNITKNALSRISTFEQAKRVTDGWLHASILTESKAIECDDYASARQEAENLLGTTTTAAMGSLNMGESLQTTGKKNYTVFKMTVEAQDKTVINSAVIRTVDRNAGTIKSEFHFNPDELAAFQNSETLNSAIMEMVAQNVKNFRAPMLATDVNKPIRLNVGNPPMPSNFIDGYILYCAFKGYELEVTPYSPDYKKAQDSMNKPGWFGFGNESKVDKFAKVWKIKHPDDVGIKEQQKLEAVAPAKRL